MGRQKIWKVAGGACGIGMKLKPLHQHCSARHAYLKLHHNLFLTIIIHLNIIHIYIYTILVFFLFFIFGLAHHVGHLIPSKLGFGSLRFQCVSGGCSLIGVCVCVGVGYTYATCFRIYLISLLLLLFFFSFFWL